MNEEPCDHDWGSIEVEHIECDDFEKVGGMALRKITNDACVTYDRQNSVDYTR